MVKALIDNSSYKSIGPMAAELRLQVKVVRTLHADQIAPLVEPALLKRCLDQADHAVETVAFTFLLHHVVKQWPKSLINLPVTIKAVSDLKSELKRTSVKLTEQMEQVLKDYEAGIFLPGPDGTQNVPFAPDEEEEAEAAEVPVAPLAHLPDASSVPGSQVVPELAAASPAASGGTPVVVSMRDRLKAASRRSK